ncbi:TetR family transcriptional regulator [Polaromonas jejuensis]|uniref:TetR family transcriptional regulator n=1 Tax=Polaromonas jejuensis TaxID=457502 RepID=A0ABW0QGG6_9BURK|nr:TetR family transcriptional regulator [Polaromonas jejuensis]
MARRTKEEALATRNKLLDAAEHVFQEQGVSGTSLQDIARRAGATRGAIYWHFKDKADLFNAMMERVTLPMEEALRHEGSEPEDSNSLNLIRQVTVNAFSQIVNNSQTRRVFEVATHKVEYVGELQAVRQRHLTVRNGFLSHFENHIDAAARQRKVKLAMPAAVAAYGFHALISGLIQNWLLDPQAFDLLEVGQCAMNVYLVGLGFSAEQGLAANQYAPPIRVA